MDLPPKDRWEKAADLYTYEQIADIRRNFVSLLKEVAPCGMTRLLSEIASYAFYANHDKEYWEELEGLSETLIDKLPAGSSSEGFSVKDLYTLNLGMEAYAYCTSGVFIDKDKVPYLFRNLDWEEDFFRNITFRVIAKRNENIIYEGVSFFPQVGLFTGVNQESAVCINYRRSPDSYPGAFAETTGMIKNAWGQMRNRDRWGASLLLRSVLEKGEDFESTIDRLESEPLISPVYFIAANKKVGSMGGGAVITRDRIGHETQSVHKIGRNGAKGVVQTNIDWNKVVGYNKAQLEPGWAGDDPLLNEAGRMGSRKRRNKMVNFLKRRPIPTKHKVLNQNSFENAG